MIAKHTVDPVAFWARATPDRPALRMHGETWTYARLEQAVSRAAASFLERGLVSGEHVSIEFDAGESLHFAASLHALHRAELLPVLIGARLTEPERVSLRARASVDYTLTAVPDDEPATKGRRPRGRRVARASAGARGGGGSSGGIPQFERRLDTPAAICFTSGTEGTPRAVALTHENFLWSALASARNLGVSAGDLWLACLPLHHVGGLSILTRSAYYGTAALIHERFDPVAVNEAIDREHVTFVSLVPPMLERILDARRTKPYPASLRAALIGGGPMPAGLLERAASLGLRALPTYGLTETASQVTTLSPREWPAGLETAGRPLPFVRVEVRSPDGRALGAREEGEIFVRGPMVSRGYFGEATRAEGAPPETGSQPQEAAREAARPWLRTGDFGTWDEAGRLVVLDRRADRVAVGGENVSPAEVERVLATHPAIAEVCVVGIPAGAWGHEVAAAVALRPGASVSLDALREHASRKLASFKLPRRLHVAAALPRNASGKVLRGEVRSWFPGEVAQENRA
ncbi:MAG: AMP-binding protein [Candidatus Latescibacteria bacterium]|nr:AMP-binding protein [Candidatus Latescibacterota bacterium]